MFNRIPSAFLLIASLALPSAAQAEVPPYMQYQGYLTSMADEPVSGFFTMTFGLYREAESGEPVWSEEREGVEVTSGRFAVRLGDRTPIDGAVFRQGQLYLQVSVEGDTLEPREAVSTVAHAFHAGIADNAVGDITPRTVSVGGQPVIDENGRWVGEIAGLQGPQGERGEVGPRGDQGERGDRGPVGDRGPQGDRGERGPAGDRGPQGEPGARGATGAQGEQGPEGVRGETGAQGIQGEVGARGPQGDQGPQGLRGETGAQGERGLIGPMPAHEWNGSQLRFRNGADSWGDYVDLRGPQGAAGRDGVAAGLQCADDQMLVFRNNNWRCTNSSGGLSRLIQYNAEPVFSDARYHFYSNPINNGLYAGGSWHVINFPCFEHGGLCEDTTTTWDLGSAHILSEVHYSYSNNTSYDHYLEVSIDGERYTTVKTFSAESGGHNDQLYWLPVRTAVRYLRFRWRRTFQLTGLRVEGSSP